MSYKPCKVCGKERVSYYGIRCFNCKEPRPMQIYNIHEVCYYVAIKNNLPAEEVMNKIRDSIHIEGNDAICFVPSPGEVDDPELKRYLEMINAEYNIDETKFLISW